jgi:hypothetical protein
VWSRGQTAERQTWCAGKQANGRMLQVNKKCKTAGEIMNNRQLKNKKIHIYKDFVWKN